MASIYELSAEFMTLWQLMEDGTLEDEALEGAFDVAKEDLADKLEGYCKFIKNLESDIAGLKEEEKRLNTRRKTMENTIERAKAAMQNAMRIAGEKKMPAGTFTVSLQQNPPKVVLDEPYIENIPVMDFRNQSIPLAKVTSFDVNKTIQRALTKAAARHGLGLYIYAGEDLPDDALEPCAEPPKEKTTKKASKPAEAKPAPKKVSPDEDPARVALREYIQLNNLNGALIAQVCGLGPQSTSQDYADALAYAKTMVGG